MRFQIHQKINHDILDLLNKLTIPRNCLFLPANTHSVSRVDCLPQALVGVMIIGLGVFVLVENSTILTV